MSTVSFSAPFSAALCKICAGQPIVIKRALVFSCRRLKTLFFPFCCQPPKFAGALSAQKEVIFSSLSPFSSREEQMKFIICCDVSHGIDCRSRICTRTPTLALKNLTTKGKSFTSLWLEASIDIENGFSPSSDNNDFWANGASTPVIMDDVFILALVNFFAMSESLKIAFMRCVVQSLERNDCWCLAIWNAQAPPPPCCRRFVIQVIWWSSARKKILHWLVWCNTPSIIFVSCDSIVCTNNCFSHGFKVDFTIAIAAVSISLAFSALLYISKFFFIIITKYMLTLTHFSKVRLKIIRINFNKCCHAYMISGRTQKLLIVNLRRLKLPPSITGVGKLRPEKVSRK